MQRPCEELVTKCAKRRSRARETESKILSRALVSVAALRLPAIDVRNFKRLHETLRTIRCTKEEGEERGPRGGNTRKREEKKREKPTRKLRDDRDRDEDSHPG